MADSVRQESGMQQYANAETMLPKGELLDDIRGTDLAVRAVWVDSIFYDIRHTWVAHDSDGREEFFGTNYDFNAVRSSNTLNFEEALSYLSLSEADDGRLVSVDTVPVEQTPIPWFKAGRAYVECPECDRWGSTHPWKLDGYLPDECGCGYDGDLEVLID